MHCAFIDFEKAFDSVWRIGLWQTLLSSNINGKCMPVSDLELYTMALNQNIVNVILVYDKEKMCHFFSLYLNDLQTCLATENIKGIESVTKTLEKDINVYLKLFVLLYADDTVLLAETADDLQHQLYCFELYCETWKLKVNAP